MGHERKERMELGRWSKRNTGRESLRQVAPRLIVTTVQRAIHRSSRDQRRNWQVSPQEVPQLLPRTAADGFFQVYRPGAVPAVEQRAALHRLAIILRPGVDQAANRKPRGVKGPSPSNSARDKGWG